MISKLRLLHVLIFSTLCNPTAATNLEDDAVMFCAVMDYPSYDSLSQWAEKIDKNKCLASGFIINRKNSTLVATDYEGQNNSSCLFDDEIFHIFDNKNYNILKARNDDLYFFLDSRFGDMFYVIFTNEDIKDLDPLYDKDRMSNLMIVGSCCTNC